MTNMSPSAENLDLAMALRSVVGSTGWGSASDSSPRALCSWTGSGEALLFLLPRICGILMGDSSANVRMQYSGSGGLSHTKVIDDWRDAPETWWRCFLTVMMMPTSEFGGQDHALLV